MLWPGGAVKSGALWMLRQELVFYAMVAVTCLGRGTLKPAFFFRILLPVLLVAPAAGGLARTRDEATIAGVLFGPFSSGRRRVRRWLAPRPATPPNVVRGPKPRRKSARKAGDRPPSSRYGRALHPSARP